MTRAAPAGRRAVVTGAGGGIGGATCARLRERGVEVVGIDIVPGDGVVEADVCDRASIERAVDDAARALGGIDILVNNAGIGRAHDSGAFPDEEARRVIDVNFFGTWNTTAAALPHLLEGRGHVVNVSSGLAFVDVPFAAAYTASKRAVAAYSAALRAEYHGRLTVTTVYPGYIRTSIHDEATRSGVSLEGIVRADSVDGAAAAIVRACLDRPLDITTSRGSTIDLWCARRMPRATSTVVAARFRRWARRTPAPGFLRFPDDKMWSKG